MTAQMWVYDEEVRIEVTSVVPMSVCVFKTKVNVEEGSMETSVHAFATAGH